MQKYRPLAEEIVAHVGGKENVNGVRHCITRLRFNLKDESKADDEYIKNLDGVVSLVKSAGEYMVVIGEHVPDVFEEVLDILGITADEAVVEAKDVSIPRKVFNFMAGAMGPVVFLFAASGIIKGILAIFAMLGWVDSSGGTYALFNAIGDAIFFFLPVFVGASTARNLKMDPMLGTLIGAILCYPAINGEDLVIFGRNINVTYTSTFLPVLLTVLFSSFIYKYAKKYISERVSQFMVPLVVLVIAVPLGYLFIGPISNIVGFGISTVINGAYNLNRVIGATLLAGLWQVFVMFGVHSIVIGFPALDVFQGIPSEIFAAIFGASFAIMGTVLGVYLKTKNHNLKKIAMPAFISTIFGVTEPSMYGVVVPRTKLFILTLIGAALSGTVSGFMRNTTYSFSGLGVFAAIGMIAPDGSGLLGIILQMVVPFIFCAIGAYIIHDDKTDPVFAENVTDAVANKSVNPNTIDAPIDQQKEVDSIVQLSSPIKGRVAPLESSIDEVFSTKVLGDGVLIYPSEGKVYAPTDGIVKSVFSTKHAIGILSDYGPEILLHIGIDTVKLNGEGFISHVKEGEEVKKGQLLLEFDIPFIESKGFSVESPMVITNSDSYSNIIKNETDNISINESIIEVYK